jgi:hypothetical protein
MKLSRTAPEYSHATNTRKGPEPDGDANDCRVEVISEAELEGAAFMAYLSRSVGLNADAAGFGAVKFKDAGVLGG